jgi:cytochrome c-type biogenesis protein CcmH/NrfF
VRRVALALVLSLACAGAPSKASASAVTTKEIEEALTCQCGCGLTVHSCNHLQCGSGIPLKQEVQLLVSQGLGRDEILVHFRDKYGEKILSAPVAEGFNLAAWILPFVVLAGGAAAVATTLARWRVAREGSVPEGGAPRSLSELDRRRLESELAKRES